MDYVVIIPARYASIRLPGKPLKLIAGIPMIQHVYQQAGKSQASDIYIATDDQRIATAATSFGAKAILTRDDHPSGTDRLQEVVALLNLPDDTVVVNVQGDEPLIPPSIIDQTAQLLLDDADASMSTLYKHITDVNDAFNPNVVKLVSNDQGHAMYFSRAPIPWGRHEFQPQEKSLPTSLALKHHIGIYGYRAALLHEFVNWPVHPLEQTEKLEQLRVLAQGHRIKVAEAISIPETGVDTGEDLNRLNQRLNNQLL